MNPISCRLYYTVHKSSELITLLYTGCLLLPSPLSKPMATPTTHIASSSTTSTALPSCTTAVPGKYGEVPITACNSSYNAIPEFIPAVVVSALFGTLTLIHIIEAFVFKKVSAPVSSSVRKASPQHGVGLYLGLAHGRRLGNNRLHLPRPRRAQPTKRCLCHSLADPLPAGAPLDQRLCVHDLCTHGTLLHARQKGILCQGLSRLENLRLGGHFVVYSPGRGRRHGHA